MPIDSLISYVKNIPINKEIKNSDLPEAIKDGGKDLAEKVGQDSKGFIGDFLGRLSFGSPLGSGSES